jgi:hypothetical protein
VALPFAWNPVASGDATSVVTALLRRTAQHPDREAAGSPASDRRCAYDHASRLIDALSDSGHVVQVELYEHAFTYLERVE